MDGTYDMPISEPPATPELGQTLPDPTVGISGDAFCHMLDKLEISMKQPVPIWTKYADPLCRALDEVEASVEQHNQGTELVTEELYEMISKLEYEIEHQPPVEPKTGQELPKEAPPNRQDNFSQMQINKQPQLIPPPSQKQETIRRDMSSPKQYREPTYRMTGQYTGIRNLGNEFVWYCNMHRKWVSEEECGSCSDFEKVDYATEDEEEERCQHSFFNRSDDGNGNVDKYLDSDSETDE